MTSYEIALTISNACLILAVVALGVAAWSMYCELKTIEQRVDLRRRAHRVAYSTGATSGGIRQAQMARRLMELILRTSEREHWRALYTLRDPMKIYPAELRDALRKSLPIRNNVSDQRRRKEEDLSSHLADASTLLQREPSLSQSKLTHAQMRGSPPPEKTNAQPSPPPRTPGGPSEEEGEADLRSWLRAR